MKWSNLQKKFLMTAHKEKIGNIPYKTLKTLDKLKFVEEEGKPCIIGVGRHGQVLKGLYKSKVVAIKVFISFLCSN